MHSLGGKMKLPAVWGLNVLPLDTFRALASVELKLLCPFGVLSRQRELSAQSVW
jgi:hypothetical protein